MSHEMHWILPVFSITLSFALMSCQDAAIGGAGTTGSVLFEADMVLDGESHRVGLEDTEDGYLLEGDILVDGTLIPELRAQAEGSLESLSVSSQNLLWPGGVVYYTVAASLPNQARVYEAMKRWSAVTPIRFVPRTNQNNYVTFRPSDGCSAHIGRVGGQQFVNLASYCNLGLTIHEIGHTIGLFHEHTRADRDSFVRVIWNNVPTNVASNFWKNDAATARGPYDFASIMHYGTYELTANGNATLLQRSNDGYIAHPQEKFAPSDGDASGVRRLYADVSCPLGNGRYCGGVLIGGRTGTLYQCTGGDISVVEACAAGCFEAPTGEPDRCASECAYGDGNYCGKNGVQGDPNKLYSCEGGTKSLVTTCGAGCNEAAAGFDDSCATTCPLGDGVYCGGVLIAGQQGSLYQCSGGDISKLETCASGCFEAPPGSPDRCN